MKKFLSFLFALVLVFGMAVPSVAEESEFDIWWEDAPKVDKDRITVWVSDAFTENGSVTHNYENGVYTITIKNDNPVDWAKAYKERGTVGAGQDFIFANIRYTGVDNTVSSYAEMTDFSEIVMGFEDRSKEADFQEKTSGKNGVFFAEIAKSEDGSAVVFPMVDENNVAANAVYSLAWKKDDGSIYYEYINVKIIVDPGKTINIPKGYLPVIQKTDGKRITADTAYPFVGSFDENTSCLKYEYSGTAITTADIAKEISKTKEAVYFSTELASKEEYEITKVDIEEGVGKAEISKNGDKVNLYSLLYENDEIYTNEVDFIVYSTNKNDQNDVFIEKISIGTVTGITWMDEAGMEPIPKERLTATNGASVDNLSNGGINVSVEDGKISITYDNVIHIDRIEENYIKILAPENAVSYKTFNTNSTDKEYYYTLSMVDEIDYSVNNFGMDGIVGKNFESFSINQLKSNKAEDIIYYYSGPELYNVCVIYWEMKDGSIKKEYITVTTGEYIASYTTDGINSEDLGKTEIEHPTVVKDHFNKGYHGNDWRFTAKYYPQESESGRTYYFELEIKGEGSENSGEYKRVYLPYNFVSDDMTYEKAVEEKLDVKIIHYLNAEHTEYEEVSGTPDKNGIYFDVKTFSPFILSWDFIAEEGSGNGNGSGEEEKPGIENIFDFIIGNGENGSADTEKDDVEEENEVNPSTGAPIVSFIPAIVSAAFILRKRRK